MTTTDPSAPRYAVLRYAVLHHTGHGPPHYDVLFERSPGGRALLTFRSPAWPITAETQLERLADHRSIYLEYEGPVSGGRGEVRAVARGTCDVSYDGRSTRITFRTGTDHPPLVIGADARAAPSKHAAPRQ
jgi:hypothetical protein